MNSRGPPPGRVGRGGGGRFGRGRGGGYYAGGGRGGPDLFDGGRGGGGRGGGGGGGVGGSGRFIPPLPRGGGGGVGRFDPPPPRDYGGGGIGRGGRGKYDCGGRGYGGRGGGGRFDDDGPPPPGRRGGGLSRMSSYSSLGRGPPPSRGSYAEMANSVPSYADLGRDIPDRMPPPDRGIDRGINRGGSFDGCDGRGGGSELGSYAMMGEMIQHPPIQAGMKRSRPPPNIDGPPQMMGPNAHNVDDGPPPPRCGGLGGGPGGERMLPGTSRGMHPPDEISGRGPLPPRADWDRDPNAGSSGPPPPDRLLPPRSRSPIMNLQPPREQDPFGRPPLPMPPRGEPPMREPPMRELRGWLPPPPLPTPDEDQFGRQRPPGRFGRGGGGEGRGGFGRSPSSGSDWQRGNGPSGGGGGSGGHNSLLMNGRFVPDASRAAAAAAAADVISNLEDNRPHQQQQQQQQQQPGSPRRDPRYSNSIVQRFDAPPDRNGLSRSPPAPFRGSPNDNLPVPLAESHASFYGASATKPLTEQSQPALKSGSVVDSASSSTQDRRPHTPPSTNNDQRPQTPLPDNNNGVDNKKSLPSTADIIPRSPGPPSPPPAPPSAYALALSRMIEMNADMQFAYVRLMMLEHQHKKVEARLGTLEKLMEEGNTNI